MEIRLHVTNLGSLRLPIHLLLKVQCEFLMFCIPFSNAFSDMLLQEYKENPDYARCVAIVASASLREMIKPGALAIISPIAVGIAF
ncbi:putative inorganic diphosphatase [Rosa chinensis]|uniref:H(+)-exporting diphosphatase n=1 Tax=Rosa chinensis TaxID=74649 RepID=A0A2P6S3W2_ROSCH|nr:putative inorganic diphosphatase [Rosa chinensis]